MFTPNSFGTASAISTMPVILLEPSNGTATFEAVCNNAGASATLVFEGSVSGNNWNAIGSSMVLSNTTPGFATTTGLNYNFYRCRVTAIAGTNALVTAYMGS